MCGLACSRNSAQWRISATSHPNPMTNNIFGFSLCASLFFKYLLQSIIQFTLRYIDSPAYLGGYLLAWTCTSSLLLLIYMAKSDLLYVHAKLVLASSIS